MTHLKFVLLLALLSDFQSRLDSTALAQTSTIQESLLAEPIDKLAASAVAEGDAARGAMVFFQPTNACAQCHATRDQGPLAQTAVGPKLTTLKPDFTNEQIVESILEPSTTISSGYQTGIVLTVDGQVITGVLVAETAEQIQLRDPATGKLLRFPIDDIEEFKLSPQSVMPVGVTQQLTSRQQFLDLVKYLIELRDGGEARSRALQPAVMPTAVALPEYESHLDHAGMIRSFDDDSLQRGQAIYQRTCANCHGTVEQPGSLPTSLRFATGKFKNGSDPFAMYQTVTRGFGLMTPQTWMVPEQKYDVIHYIRETFLKPHNPSQFSTINDDYLATMPVGDTRGPEPSSIEPWAQMDYGPNLMATFEVGNDATNFAYKGHAIRLDHGPGGITQGQHRMLYEHDTMRVAAVWSGPEFIDYNGIMFNGQHQIHPRPVGKLLFTNRNGAGWANPADGTFTDVRDPGRDGRFYGPLPEQWIDYRGTHVCGPDTILSYRVGQTEILEMPALEMMDDVAVVKRHFFIAQAKDNSPARPLTLRVADLPAAELKITANEQTNFLFHLDPQQGSSNIAYGIMGDLSQFKWKVVRQELHLELPLSSQPQQLTLVYFPAATLESFGAIQKKIQESFQPLDLVQTLENKSQRWPEVITTTVVTVDDGGPFAIDTLNYPQQNPWSCRMRLTGFDFFEDGESAAVCDWDGNVWKVSGLHKSKLTWQRIGSGLFQPLGLKIRDGQIFVSCRDQICLLHDQNGDGETDYYEAFNHDHQVTEHFHEFAMGLQTDDAGNFYYAKSARHALPALVPHHGTLLKVSADGKQTEILATGFRAANGVCLNDDGTFFVTDQEGHWNPKNRINWVKPGGFYGNMFGYHDVTDASDDVMAPPLCWITNSFDRSPSELLWVPPKQWGPLGGSLLNFSYGYGKIYVVPHEPLGNLLQGGMCELPIPQFDTGTMRGRFHPTDGGLYLAGMFAWAGDRVADGGFYRVRATGKPIHAPIRLHCTGTTVRIGLTDDIDSSSVSPEQFLISRWKIKRTENYGSEHFDTTPMSVRSARWSAKNREIILEIPDLQPTWCMEIICNLKTTNGETIVRTIHNTIHSTDQPSQ